MVGAGAKNPELELHGPGPLRHNVSDTSTRPGHDAPARFNTVCMTLTHFDRSAADRVAGRQPVTEVARC
jgi:hypothetical protein